MNLYVGNLSSSVSEADLQFIFEGLGQIVFAKFADVDDISQAKGYAFVQVQNDAQALTAIAGLNGRYLKGLRLIVRPVIERERDNRNTNIHDAAWNNKSKKTGHLHLHLVKNDAYSQN